MQTLKENQISQNVYDVEELALQQAHKTSKNIIAFLQFDSNYQLFQNSFVFQISINIFFRPINVAFKTERIHRASCNVVSLKYYRSLYLNNNNLQRM